MLKHLSSLWNGLQKYAGRPWYLPLISFLAASDLFILVVPSDALLITAVLLRPARWVRAFLCVSTGSALGAVVLTYLVQWDSAVITERWFHGAFHSPSWQRTAEFISTHGDWALAALALSPLPQQPAVVLAALGGMSALKVFVSVWIGRAIKYALLAWLASHAPRFLRKLSVGREALGLAQPQEHSEK